MIASRQSSPVSSLASTAPRAAIAAVRSQAAFLRSLLDEVERLAPASSAHHESVSDQIIEELARLGCRTIEAASLLTRVVADARRCA